MNRYEVRIYIDADSPKVAMQVYDELDEFMSDNFPANYATLAVGNRVDDTDFLSREDAFIECASLGN